MISWEQFLVLARERFKFLETDYKFMLESEKTPFLIFASSGLEVRIFYDVNERGELDLGIERKIGYRTRFPSYGIPEFKRLVGLIDTNLSPFPQNEEEMCRELDVLAKDLKTYCHSVLTGDMEDFDLIEKDRKEAERKYT